MPTSTFNTLVTEATNTTGNTTLSSISVTSGSNTQTPNTTVTGSVSITGSASYTFKGSLYIDGGLTIGTSGTVTFDGPVYVTDNLTVSSSESGTIACSGTGSLMVINGDVGIAGSGQFGSQSAPFLLIETNNGRNINLSGSGVFYGIAYGEYANLAVSDTSTSHPCISGAVYVEGIGNMNQTSGLPWLIEYNATVVQNLNSYFTGSSSTSGVQTVPNTWQQMQPY